MRLYLIGSLRNPNVQSVAASLRAVGYEVFDDWSAVGPEADDHWKTYEQARGRSFREALTGEAAQNAFQFDKRNLDASDGAIMVMPAGKSGHLELGYMAGLGKFTAILFNEPDPDRWDIMYQFADEVYFSVAEMIGRIPPVYKIGDVAETTPKPRGFKVGDKVQWLGRWNSRMYTPGEVYEIKGSDPGGFFLTDDNSSVGNHFWGTDKLLENFELIRP